jgi:modification methylase
MLPAKRVQTLERVLQKVVDVRDHCTLLLSDGTLLTLGGIRITDEEGAKEYLKTRIRGKEISYRTLDPLETKEGTVTGLVYLKNRIFVNRYMVRSGMAQDAGLPKGRR